MTSGLRSNGRVVDNVHKVTLWPVVGSPTVPGAHGGGGGSSEWRQRPHATKMAQEALNLSTIYVSVYVGEW